ncbi:DUF4309 domain-containing protein [Aneurinibacillus sp. REN35]|uniref:DUF4309 domain-containing protein n=1 Tax=Aneurinibacillus sp. REN35 TaxID=3237286 RepID=UPI0035277674
MLRKNSMPAALLAAMLFLPACQPAAEPAAAPTTVDQQASTEPVVDPPQNEAAPSNPVQKEAPSADQTSIDTQSPKQGANGAQQSEKITLASEIYQEAKLGKVFFYDFGLGTKKETIIKQWGKPDAESSDTSLTYQQHSVTFLLDPNSQQVTFISSDHPKFQMIYITQVKKELGAPVQENRIPDENLIQAIYQAGSYTLAYVYDDSDKIVRYIELKQTKQETLLQQVMNRAAAGKVTNSEFALGAKENTILSQWGKPEEQDTGFLFYKKKGVMFSIDEPAKTVSMITSYDPQLKTYTLEQVKKALGKPVKEYGSDGDYMVFYKSGTHSVYFGFEYPNEKNNKNPKLQYVYIV